jgi:hypothetical protein
MIDGSSLDHHWIMALIQLILPQRLRMIDGTSAQ